MPIRLLGADDIDAAVGLSAAAGWNQTGDDWRFMLEHGRGYGMDDPEDGRLIATAVTLPYEGFAWISMVLVARDRQQRGYAGHLMRRAVDDLRAAGLVPILDATPAGRPVYLKMGFQDAWGMRRWALPALSAVPQPGVRPLREEDWPALAAFDRNAFGADRTALLRHLSMRLPEAALVHESNGRLGGYLLGRDGRRQRQLGPLVAENEQVAIDLLAAAGGSPAYIDLADRHAEVSQWLEAKEARVERPLTRMALGRTATFDDRALTIAVAGPELG